MSTFDMTSSSRKSLDDVQISPHAPVSGGKVLYSPHSGVEYLSALYTWWSVLDAVVKEHNYGCNDKSPYSHPSSQCLAHHDRFNPYAFGYMRPEQAKVYAKHINMYGDKNTTKDILYCEIGTNGGHSSVMALLASEKLQMVSFDMQEWTYTKEIARLLTAAFPGRFTVQQGSSFDTVPKFFTSNKDLECNIALVDGLHTRKGVTLDLENLYYGMSCDHLILIDDLQSPAGEAVNEMVNNGKLEIIDKRNFPMNSEEACLRLFVAKDSSARKRKYLSYADVQRDYGLKYLCDRTNFSFAVAKFKGKKYGSCS